MKSIYFLIAMSLISAGKAFADERHCLAKIMYAEEGQSFEGAVAVGQATITRADNQEVSVCQVKGVKRKALPKPIAPYYLAVATELLTRPKTSVVGNADSWNTGKKPRQPGKITRIIGNHVYYEAR